MTSVLPALGWVLCAGVASVPLWKVLSGLVEWEGSGGKLTIGSPTSIALVGSMGLALAYFGGSVSGVLGGAGAIGTAAANSYSAPNTPTATSVMISDTSGYANASAFIGSLDDSVEYTIFEIDSLRGDFSTAPLLVDTQTYASGHPLRSDTIFTYTANDTFKVRTKHKGFASGLESAYSVVDTFVATAVNLFPNEPAGMTELCYADGSVGTSGSDAFGCGIGNWNRPNNVLTRSDPDNPSGSGSRIHFVWDSSTGGGWTCCQVNLDIGGAAEDYDTLYMAMEIYYYDVPNPEQSHKFGYFVSGNGGTVGSNFWISNEGGDNWINREVGVENWRCASVLPLEVERPDSRLVELVIYHESSANADDGTVLTYVEDSLVGTGGANQNCTRQGNFTFNDGAGYDTWFDYFQMYNTHNNRSSEPNNDSTALRYFKLSAKE